MKSREKGKGKEERALRQGGTSPAKGETFNIWDETRGKKLGRNPT